MTSLITILTVAAMFAALMWTVHVMSKWHHQIDSEAIERSKRKREQR